MYIRLSYVRLISFKSDCFYSQYMIMNIQMGIRHSRSPVETGELLDLHWGKLGMNVWQLIMSLGFF